jgi:hypothetical protein
MQAIWQIFCLHGDLGTICAHQAGQARLSTMHDWISEELKHPGTTIVCTSPSGLRPCSLLAVRARVTVCKRKCIALVQGCTVSCSMMTNKMQTCTINKFASSDTVRWALNCCLSFLPARKACALRDLSSEYNDATLAKTSSFWASHLIVLLWPSSVTDAVVCCRLVPQKVEPRHAELSSSTYHSPVVEREGYIKSRQP